MQSIQENLEGSEEGLKNKYFVADLNTGDTMWFKYDRD